MSKSTASTPEYAGDTLAYTFQVENTGNISIANVSIQDIKCQNTPSYLTGSDTANVGVLDPGEIWTYGCQSIAVLQSEVDAEQVNNTATVS